MPLSRRLWQRPSDVVASFLLLMYDLGNMRLPRFRTLYSSACSLAFSLVLVQRRLSGPGSREVGPSPGGFSLCQWTSESAGLDFRLLQLFSFLNSLSIRPGGGRRREQSNGRFGVHFSRDLAGGRNAKRRARVFFSPRRQVNKVGMGFPSARGFHA